MAFYAGQKLRTDELGQLSTTARYQHDANQSISNATVTECLYTLAQRSSTIVTKATSGSGHKFTLGASGLWAISFTERFTAAANGFRESWIEHSDGTRISNSPLQQGTASNDAMLHTSITTWLNSGEYVIVKLYQNSGGAINRTPNATFGWSRLDFAYLLGEG